MNPQYIYKGVIRRVIDGDTVEVDIDLGFSVWRRESVRLFGINAPELHSSDKAEREWAGKACERLNQLLPAGHAVNLKTHQDKEKYGRYLAEAVTDKGVNVSEAMLASGLAVRYTGGARQPFAVAFAHLLKQT